MDLFGLIVSNNYIAVLYLSMFTDKVQVLEFPGAFGGLLAFGLPALFSWTFSAFWFIVQPQCH